LLSDLTALKQELDFSTFTGTHVWKFRKTERRWLFAAVTAIVIAAISLVIVWGVTTRKAGVSRGLPGEARQVTSGDSWHGDPALSPDGSRIAYASDESGSGEIYITTVHGGKTLKITDDPAADYYPAWFPDGTALAFVSERGGKTAIWKVSALGGGATLLIRDARDPAISLDAGHIAFSTLPPDGDQRIGIARLADPEDVRILTGDRDGLWEHRMPAWSPNGKEICYASRQDLWVVPVSGGPARRFTRDGKMDSNPAWSPDGGHVYFSSVREGTLAIWRIASRGGAVERLTTGSGYEHDPAISLDGSRFAYATRTEPGALCIRDLASGTEVKLPGVRDECLAAIAPDGSSVVYASDLAGPARDLWMQPIDHGAPSGQPRRLTEDSVNASCPAFSPDGKWIAYYRIAGEQRDIYIVSVSGDQPVRFTDDPARDVQPEWSPDGSLIAFSSDRGGRWQLWAAPVSEGRSAGPRRLITRDSIDALAPAWSPDGRLIAYVGSDETGSEAWIVPFDGREAARKVTSGAEAGTVRWDPTTGSLLVSGTWSEDRRSIRTISLGAKTVAPLEPPVVLGSGAGITTFDVSRDGRLLVFPRENNKGHIWVHEARKQTF
jgi:Tol biopolymer transport system component